MSCSASCLSKATSRAAALPSAAVEPGAPPCTVAPVAGASDALLSALLCLARLADHPPSRLQLVYEGAPKPIAVVLSALADACTEQGGAGGGVVLMHVADARAFELAALSAARLALYAPAAPAIVAEGAAEALARVCGATVGIEPPEATTTAVASSSAPSVAIATQRYTLRQCGYWTEDRSLCSVSPALTLRAPWHGRGKGKPLPRHAARSPR